MLYAPTLEEISSVISEATARAAHLHAELADAGDLLRPLALLYAAGGWHCPQPGLLMRTVSFTACSCGAAGLCPHRLALLAYREILATHLRRRVLGDSAHWREEAHRAPNAGLLTYAEGERRCTVLYYDRPRALALHPICQAVRGPRGWTFATEADLHLFAAWLHRADPLPADQEALSVYRTLVAAGAPAAEACAAADSVLLPAAA